jgi:hypothetical protein
MFTTATFISAVALIVSLLSFAIARRVARWANIPVLEFTPFLGRVDGEAKPVLKYRVKNLHKNVAIRCLEIRVMFMGDEMGEGSFGHQSLLEPGQIGEGRFYNLFHHCNPFSPPPKNTPEWMRGQHYHLEVILAYTPALFRASRTEDSRYYSVFVPFDGGELSMSFDEIDAGAYKVQRQQLSDRRRSNTTTGCKT